MSGTPDILPSLRATRSLDHLVVYCALGARVHALINLVDQRERRMRELSET